MVSILLLFTVSSSCAPDRIKASLGAEFTLPLGKTAVIEGENLTFEFVEVTADSRCAKGVECIWAGEAKCRMKITYKGTESEIIFTQPGEVVNSFGSLSNYNVMYRLEPYPEINKQIISSDYKLIMIVTK